MRLRRPPSDPLLRLEAFAGLSPHEAAVLLRHVDVLLVPDGWSCPARPGPALEAVLVVEGVVQLLGPHRTQVGPGGWLHLGALIDGRPAVAPLRTLGPCRLGVVSRSQYRALHLELAVVRDLGRRAVAEDRSRAHRAGRPRAAVPAPSVGPPPASGRVAAASPPP